MKFIKTIVAAAGFLVLSMCAVAPVTAAEECFTVANFFEVAEEVNGSSPVALTKTQIGIMRRDYNSRPPLDVKFPAFDFIYHSEKGTRVVLIGFIDGCAVDSQGMDKITFDNLMASGTL